jgi:hypothetical protein
VEELEKVVSTWGSDWLKYVGLISLALWGGTASHLSRMKRMGMPFSLPELIGEWVICGFAGMLTLLLCEAYGVNMALTGAFTGIAGHMGGRAIFMIQQKVFNSAPFLRGVQEETQSKRDGDD